MNDEAGFRLALEDDPADDATRLAYADWLEERGDTRAEYLRLEHQLSQIPLRLAQLRKQIDPVWLARVRKRGRGMFSDQFRQRLKVGKYSRWAEDLTKPHLEALLWMVGEYGFRAKLILDVLDAHEETAWDEVAFARAKHALETMARIVGGERMDLDELCRRVREAIAQVLQRRRESR
jgi:uncharacterized protein (TIGR02996 family)